jgi:hypothetical protein
MTGSFGISMLLSLAWSQKFNPMQTILLGLAIVIPARQNVQLAAPKWRSPSTKVEVWTVRCWQRMPRQNLA